MPDEQDRENPYSTPQTSPELLPETDVSYHISLASRWTRLGASIIDGIIMMAVLYGVLFLLTYTGLYGDDYYETEYVENSYSSLIYEEPSESLMTTVIDTVLAIIIYLVINGYFMVKSGQTLGKKALGIQVVCHRSHQLLSPGRILGLRFVFPTILGYFELFSLLDALFIFSAEKRCLHDHFAGSIVINKNPAL